MSELLKSIDWQAFGEFCKVVGIPGVISLFFCGCAIFLIKAFSRYLVSQIGTSERLTRCQESQTSSLEKIAVVVESHVLTTGKQSKAIGHVADAINATARGTANEAEVGSHVQRAKDCLE